VICTEAVFCHELEPPETVGAVGAVRSMRAVLAEPAAAGAQFDARPEVSTARNCTSVWPAVLTVTLPPVVAADHVTPPSVELRYW
jgi:hypothetical protein